ncbi:hypothetical protein GHK65_07275 [Sinorhizobium meliloti]|nr:hypothetical protein [Sinorhizobium meliloti]
METSLGGKRATPAWQLVTKILTGSGSAERGANSSDGSRSPRASRLACSLWENLIQVQH